MLCRYVVGAALGATLLCGIARSAPPPAAAARLNEPGPESRRLEQRVGLWDVTETLWAAPGAPPVTSTGLVAERVMVGTLLQESIRPPSDAAHAAVARTDLLAFNRLEGRWGYVSFDTRVPVGLMPAWSTTAGDGSSIEVTFAPFAIPRPDANADAVGQLLRMDEVIRFEGPDRDVKDQYFMLADGSGERWLAHRYAYVRRPSSTP